MATYLHGSYTDRFINELLMTRYRQPLWSRIWPTFEEANAEQLKITQVHQYFTTVCSSAHLPHRYSHLTLCRLDLF
jgi:hypothetical protein